MPRRNKPQQRSSACAVAAWTTLAAIASGLGGCQEYFDRSDTITLGVADASETNKAVQTITRWPNAARKDRWLSDGERSRTAIARYRANKVVQPKTLSGKAAGGGGDAPMVPDTPIQAGPSEGK